MNNTITNKNGQLSSVEGPDAMDVFRIRTLRLAIKLIIDTKGRIQPTRGFTLTKGLTMATEYTGIKYKRTEGAKAMEDLEKIMQLRLQHIEINEV